MMNGTICNSSINNSCEVYNNDTLVKEHFNYKIVVYSMVCLLGITGNGLVIWFCLFKMVKTVNVIWFLNLAVADFTFALVLPFLIISLALHDEWPFGNFMCKFIWFLVYLNMAISVLQLAVISVDRCLCVVFPVWCHNHRKIILALIVVLVIWIISIVSTLPYYLYKYTFVNYKNNKTYCYFSSDKVWVPMARFFFFFLFLFIVIISSYTVLIFRIKGKSIIRSSKPFQIIIVMVIAFFVCWFPYYLFLLIYIFDPKNFTYAHNIGFEIGLDLMYVNCCINPILYVFIGQDFKQKCCSSFQAVFEKAFREDIGQMNFMKSKRSSSSGLVLTSTNTSIIKLFNGDSSATVEHIDVIE